jgi:hypothetical protein
MMGMTKINRASADKVITNIFIDALRVRLSDPLSPARTNSNWIRSKSTIRTDIIPAGNQDLSRKRYLQKESDKPDFPEVVVGGYRETNEITTINLGNGVYYRVPCELTIRVLDNSSDVTRIGNLISQISYVLRKFYVSDLQSKGISNLEWSIIPTPGFETDSGEYNEKQVLLTFTARVDEWQL